MTAAPEWTALKSIALHRDDAPERLWPEGASAEYVAARDGLREAERALRDQVEAVAARRRALPPGPVLPDYRLEGDEGPVSLRDLFGEHDTLVVYHLMFHPDDDEACPMCSLWIDGLHGVSHHLTRHTAFAVIGKAPIAKLRAWADRRGWDGLRIVSSHDSPFNADLGVEEPGGGQWPAVSAFVREGGEARHFLTVAAPFPDGSNRGMDLLSPVWNVFDLLPQGRGEWLPDNRYPGRGRG